MKICATWSLIEIGCCFIINQQFFFFFFLYVVNEFHFSVYERKTLFTLICKVS